MVRPRFRVRACARTCVFPPAHGCGCVCARVCPFRQVFLTFHFHLLIGVYHYISSLFPLEFSCPLMCIEPSKPPFCSKADVKCSTFFCHLETGWVSITQMRKTVLRFAAKSCPGAKKMHLSLLQCLVAPKGSVIQVNSSGKQARKVRVSAECKVSACRTPEIVAPKHVYSPVFFFKS